MDTKVFLMFIFNLQDDQSLFGDSLGGNGDDFDLSKLQALLRKNSLEIDNILRGTVSEKLVDKSARSLSFSELTSPREVPDVKNALGEDLTVSYESKPSGGFSVFYTVPKEPLEKTEVEKIKDLIENINAETLLSERLKNSLEEDSNEYYDDYYEDEYDDEYYEDDDYYAEDTLQSIRTLKMPPSEDDDYYDPGPPASYYDDAADYIDEDDDFDYMYDDEDDDYDYEDDYYYDEAEDRMMIQSSTLRPEVLSPTIQKLTALTLQSLNSGKKKKRKSRKKKKRRKSIDRSFDLSGKNNRSKRSTSDDNNSVHNVDNNALDLSKFSNDMSTDGSSLDPKLYDVKVNKEIIDPISESSEYTPYHHHSDWQEEHSSYHHSDWEDEPYHYEEEPYHFEDEPYHFNDYEIYYDEMYLDENDVLQPFKPKKKPPVATRTWLDNVLKFRESLFGKHGKPQVMFHYPKDEDPFVTLTEARRPPLNFKPNVVSSGGGRQPLLPPVVSIQNPSTVVSQPATVISQPAITISNPATTISQPAISVQTPGVNINQPAIDILNTNIQPRPDVNRVPILDIVNNPGTSITDFVRSETGARANLPTSINTLNTLARLRQTATIPANDDSATITRFVQEEDLMRIQDLLGNGGEKENHHKKKHKKHHKKHKDHGHSYDHYHDEPYHKEHHKSYYEDYHEPYYEQHYEPPYVEHHDHHFHEKSHHKEHSYFKPNKEYYYDEPHHKKHSYNVPKPKYYPEKAYHENPYMEKHDNHNGGLYEKDVEPYLIHGKHHAESYEPYHEEPIFNEPYPHEKSLSYGNNEHHHDGIHYEEDYLNLHGNHEHHHKNHYAEDFFGHPYEENKHGHHEGSYEKDVEPYLIHDKHLPDVYSTSLFLRSDGSYKPTTELQSIPQYQHQSKPISYGDLLLSSYSKEPGHHYQEQVRSKYSNGYPPPHLLPDKHRIIPFIPPSTADPPVQKGPTFLPKHEKTTPKYVLPQIQLNPHVVHHSQPVPPIPVTNPPLGKPFTIPSPTLGKPFPDIILDQLRKPHPQVVHHSTSSAFASKPHTVKIPLESPKRHLIATNPDIPPSLVTISIGQGLEPSVSISAGQVSKPDIVSPKPIESSIPPKQILFPTSNNISPPIIPHNNLEHGNAVKIDPKTIEALEKLGFHYQPEITREIPLHHLPPTIYDKAPPTLYEQVHENKRVEQVLFAPPKLSDYLPPTLFDPETSINKPQMSYRSVMEARPPKATQAMYEEEKEVSHPTINPFEKFISKDNDQYYSKPKPPPYTSIQKLPLNVGVGSKSGPSPGKVYKAQLRYPVIPPSPTPAIKFEVYNKSQPAIRFENSKKVFPVKYLTESERKSLHPDEYLNSKLIDKNKTYKYKSMIRYNNHEPYRSEKVTYPKPSDLKHENDIDEKYISVLERERIYRNDFPTSRYPNDLKDPKEDFEDIEKKFFKIFERERVYRNDFPIQEENIVTKRQITPSSVPCHGNSKYFMENCVLVKRNSSIMYDQEVIPSSQVSTLPFPTQIPRPPSKLPYLPLAKYKSTTIKQEQNLIKSLPTLPSVRNNPQYPNHNSYVLAKLKRSDIPR